MATARIQVSCNFAPHTATNPNAYADVVPCGGGGQFQSEGVVCPDNVLSDICFRMSEPFPQTIHGTPNPKLRVTLLTDVAGTSNFKLQAAWNLVTKGTTSSGFTPSFSAQTGASAGQWITKQLEFTLTGTPAAGQLYEGVLRRDGADAADQIAGIVQVTEVVVIADDTT